MEEDLLGTREPDKLRPGPGLSPEQKLSEDGAGGPAGAAPSHIVQFYEDDSFLTDCVAGFLAPSISAGEPMVVIATRPHLDLISQRLDVARGALAGGSLERLVLLEATLSLAKFMVGTAPDPDRFRSHLGEVLEKVAGGNGSRRPPRVFGGIVDSLWRGGNSEAAIRIEELWNELGQAHPFHLMCGYHMGTFADNAHAERFSQLCAAHAHVIPTEKYSEGLPLQARLREVSRLQQRERALETELAHRKKLEEALKEAVEERERLIEGLKRTVRFSDLFLGILGHDLRNPLNAIVTSASLLRRRAEDEKLTKPIGRILSSADRMARMIDQLLDFTQIRLGTGLRLDCLDFDLQKVCQTVLEALEAADEGCAAELRFAGSPLVFGDADRVSHLVSNLAGNALHHRVPGTPVHVGVDGTQETSLRLEFHNEGCVPPELVPTMFEPFHGNAEKKSGHSSGLGLGLFVSQQIVLAHGGRIAVDSSEARGTTVTVELPRKAFPYAYGRDFSPRAEESVC
jgi:signal transduction histidine kinase